jgi:hypothetical protein
VNRDEEQIDWFDLGSVDGPVSGKPPRQPWPRWFTLAVVAAVVVALGLAALNHRRGARTAASVTSPPTSPSKASPTVSAPSETATTTTAAPLPTDVSVTAVGHPLLGTTAGWELFGRGPGLLVRIQPAAGRITRTALPNFDSSGLVLMLAGSDRVVIRTFDEDGGYLVPDGKPVRRPSANLDVPIFPGPGRNQAWVPRAGNDGAQVMGLVSLDGTTLEGKLPVPPESSLTDAVSDGAGYLLFPGLGGLYDARPDGLHRITTGGLLAAGPTGWLVLECDEQHRCHPVLVGRRDGSRRVVNAAFDRVGHGLISPDGSTAALLAANPEGGSGLELLDLATGKRRDLGISIDEQSFGGTFAFSPDGRWLFTVTIGGTLAVVNCRTGAIGPLGVPLPTLNQLVVRPALAAAGRS